jgi:16S rRNA (adenine1518-N6/adenine1519-N6)-dimethyltransferase
VLEIGPGTGVLTKELLKLGCRVTAVEKDAQMISSLECQNLGPCALKMIHADFLELDLMDLFHERSLFCGNLPYNISTPILFKLRENRRLFERGVVMLQKEVADRLVAGPGSKDYGILSILMQVTSKIERCFNVSPGSFRPPPRVTSTVVKMQFYKEPPCKINNMQLFETIVKLAFGKRRKMIRNTLPGEYLPFLERCGISAACRAEEVPIEAYARLSNLINP